MFPNAPQTEEFAPKEGENPLDDIYRSGKSPTFLCRGHNCKLAGKIWPRLDNFKSHVLRMHEGEDCQSLVKRYVVTFWICSAKI
jgi:hypothetical protein